MKLQPLIQQAASVMTAYCSSYLLPLESLVKLRIKLRVLK